MRAVRKIETFKGPGVVNNPAGVAFYQPQAGKAPVVPLRRDTWLKISGNVTGGGKYYGYRMNANTSAGTIALTGSVAESDLGTPDTTSVVILNSAELGKTTHALTAGTPVSKYFRGTKLHRKASDGRDVYWIVALDVESCS